MLPSLRCRHYRFLLGIGVPGLVFVCFGVPAFIVTVRAHRNSKALNCGFPTGQGCSTVNTTPAVQPPSDPPRCGCAAHDEAPVPEPPGDGRGHPAIRVRACAALQLTRCLRGVWTTPDEISIPPGSCSTGIIIGRRGGVRFAPCVHFTSFPSRQLFSSLLSPLCELHPYKSPGRAPRWASRSLKSSPPICAEAVILLRKIAVISSTVFLVGGDTKTVTLLLLVLLGILVTSVLLQVRKSGPGGVAHTLKEVGLVCLSNARPNWCRIVPPVLLQALYRPYSNAVLFKCAIQRMFACRK